MMETTELPKFPKYTSARANEWRVAVAKRLQKRIADLKQRFPSTPPVTIELEIGCYEEFLKALRVEETQNGL